MEAVKTRKKKGKRKSKAGENRKNDCPDTNLVTENCKENTPATTSNLLVAGEQSGTGATAVNKNSKSCNEVENSETFGNQGIPDVGLSSPPCNNYGDDSVTVDTVSQEEDSLQAKAENKPLLADSSNKLDVSSDVLQPGSTEDEAVILKLEEDKNDVDVSSADVLQPRSTEDEAVILKLEEDKNDVDVSSADVLLPQSTEDEAVILKLEEDKNDVDVSSVGHGSSNIETKTFVKDDGNENFIHEETLNAASYVHESIKHRQHDESVEAPDVLHRERASTAPPLEREDSVVDQDNINEEIMEEEKSGAMPCIPESTKSISLTENIMARDVIHRERASTAPPLERENSTQHQLTDTENAQLMMPATASSLYPTLQAIKEPELQPYTEERLKEFYYNPQLAQFNQSVDTFLGIAKQEHHILYKLVLGYFQSSSTLISSFKDNQSLKSQCNNYQNSLWISTQHQLTQNGHCEDDHRVSHTYTFETVQLNSDALTFLHDVLGKIRCGLQESLSMNQYLCQLYKLHIDVYLYDMINSSSVLKHLATQTPFSSAITPQILNEHTDTLRQCISVFFAFMRRHSEDEKFIQDIKCWLNHLISLLLNVQSYDDSFFILNHLIRCPGGIGSWASQFVQPIVSGLHSSDCKWNDAALDHFIVSLGATVFPIKCRDEFLSFIPQDNSSGSRDSWTLVTEEGLEDDSVENYFLRLRESDLISIYSQFAFDKLFCYLLRLSNSGTEDLYFIQQPIDSHYVMKVFVVTSTIIKLLSSAFSTYNSIHYNQYVKTICKTIREIIHFISDFWQHYQATRAITENDWNEVPIERLVTEYDQFFMKATHAVWIGRDLQTWQYLVDLPYHCVSSKMLWKLFWLFHLEFDSQEVEVTMCTERDYQDDWKGVLYEEDRLSKFANNLKSVSLSDGIHLLTIFSIMTEACETNSNFIQMVTLELFEICYVYESTRELYYKTGRELLNYISLRNPSIVTLLLHRVEFMFNEVGNMALYLFKGLPIICWTPEEEDFNLIRNWLVQCNISSLKNQLARFIISELNWSTCKRTDLLALSRPVHNETASMIVEVYTEKIKGSDFENNDFGRQIASILPANSTIALYGPQSEVLAWCWDTATHLKLHGTSLQTLSLIFSYACASKNVQVDIHNLEAVPLTATLTGTYDQMPSAYENPMLLPLRQCADDHIPLGCYLLLSMTSVGHFPSDFLAHGLRYFECIIDSGYYKASLCVLYNVIPAFFEHDENESLLESPIFLKAIESVLAADIKYRPLQFIPKFIYDKNNEITGSIASLIQTHCFHYANHLSPIEFWTRVFLNIYDWAKNECIQLIFDELAKVAFLIPDGLEIMSKIIAEKYDKGEVVKDQQSGILQSFFSWVASGFQGSTTRQSFLDEAGNGEYPWFAFVILCADQEYEIQSGILRQMTLELLQNASIGIDAALKKSISRLDIHAPYSSTNLCIYRWVQQALTTDMSHPILPLIWQKFFSLYLSQSDCGLGIRGSVGHRYFKNMSSLIHRVKERLLATSAYFRSLMDSNTEDENESNDRNSSKKLLLNKLKQFYQTLALWLEEPRLHDTSLYLPSLPIQYNPELLGRLYNKTGELWLEYVDLTAIYEDVYNNIRSWLLQYAPFTLASKFELSSSSHSGREEALTRINLRLRRYEASQPPPEVKETIEPFAVLPRNLFEDDQQLLSALKSDFRIIVESSQEFSTRVAALNSSDIEYLNLLPNVYHNAPSTVTVNVPCNNWLRGTAACKGPAQLTFDFQAKHEREEVSRQIQANREGYERLSKFFVTPVSEILCHAAARIELVISNLVKEFSIANTDTGRRKICSSASSVFYAIVAMLDNDTKTYLPIERFLNSCIQTLGMQFIHNNPAEMESLLSFAIQHPGKASAVAAYFSPNVLPNRIVAMYSSILQMVNAIGSSEAELFLARFDISKWLSGHPMLSERSRLLEVIVNGLVACGVNPSERDIGLFRYHSMNFKFMLEHQFPDHFAESLKLILANCKVKKLNLHCLSDFIDTIVMEVDSKSFLSCLRWDELKQVIDWLAVFFLDIRLNTPMVLVNADSHRIITCNSFYDNWTIYLNLLQKFFENLFSTFISKSARQDGASNSVISITDTWSCLTMFFEPWICVIKNSEDTKLACPWNNTSLVPGLTMTRLFLTLTRLLLDEYQDRPFGQEAIINLLWKFYYINSSPCTPDLVLNVYHETFINVQWSIFKPDLSVMESMLSVSRTLERQSITFVGSICSEINWSTVIERARGNLNTSDFIKLHEQLLKILILYSLDKGTLASKRGEMTRLLQTAENYDWHLINFQTYSDIIKIFHSRCSPIEILDELSGIHLTTRLMQIVAGFYKDSCNESLEEISEKRVSYIRCIIKLLCTCTMQDVMPAKKYNNAIIALLSTIERITGVSNARSDFSWELTTLLSEFLRLFNQCSSKNDYSIGFSEQVLKFMNNSCYLDLQLACITAATQTLASVRLMVGMVESLIGGYFNQLKIAIDSGNDLIGGWSLVYRHLIVPELNLDEFISQCLKNCAFLTLYGHILQQLPLCRNIQDERLRLEILTNWNGNTKLTKEIESKGLLIWAKILELIIRQIQYGGDEPEVIAILRKFISQLYSVAEDRSSSGILGAIGLGKKSNLSLSFRLTAKALAIYLESQMPVSAVTKTVVLRKEPTGEGAIGDSVRYRTGKNSKQVMQTGAVEPSTHAVQMLRKFEALQKNKEYTTVKNIVCDTSKYILDSKNALPQCYELLTKLVKKFYPDNLYLGIIQQYSYAS